MNGTYIADIAADPETIVTYALISVISFVLGSLIGWSAAQNLDEMEKSSIRQIMAIVMLGAYIVSLMADIGIPEYHTPFLLHTIMGGIFGYLFSKGDGVNVNFTRNKK